jgi:hypothetical protein
MSIRHGLVPGWVAERLNGRKDDAAVDRAENRIPEPSPADNGPDPGTMKKTEPKMIKKRPGAKKAAFLRAYADNGSITSSARIAGIDRTTHYEWIARDTKYQAAFHRARLMAKDAVFDELVRRGVKGVFKPYIYKGELQYATRERTLCTLADGATAFEDELPEDATVFGRQTVTVRGELLGVYKCDERALWKVLQLALPLEFGSARLRKGKKGPRRAGFFYGTGLEP